MLKYLAGTVALSLSLSLTAFTATSQEMRAWNIHVEGYPNTVAMDKFADLVAEKTDGRVTIKNFHAGVLGSQPDAIEQVRLGGIEIGNFNLGPIGPIVPEANVVSLPFIFNDVAHMNRAMDGEAGQQISDGMAKKGLIALAWYDSGARSFYNSVRPINTPADLDGLKVRVMGNVIYSNMISELGGNPTPMAFSEVFQSLSTGVIDGAENNWPSYESTNHFEVAGFYSLSQHLIIPECVCINADVFNGLSAEDQTAFTEAARESAVLQRELWAERALSSRKMVMDAGVVFNEIADKGPFQEAMIPVYANYLAENPDIKPLVELIQNTE